MVMVPKLADRFKWKRSGDLYLPEVTWRSSNPLVAVVDRFGVVTCVGPGTVAISAIYGPPGPARWAKQFTATMQPEQVGLAGYIRT